MNMFIFYKNLSKLKIKNLQTHFGKTLKLLLYLKGLVEIITWGIGITRITLIAGKLFCIRCRCKEYLIGKVQSRFDFLN